MLVPMGRAQDSEVRGSGFDTYLNLKVTLSKILCPPEYCVLNPVNGGMTKKLLVYP